MNEGIHCEVQVVIVKIFVCWSRAVDGSQGSFHTEIDDHVPTLLISPLQTRDLAEIILLQPYDGEYERISSRGEAFL